MESRPHLDAHGGIESVPVSSVIPRYANCSNHGPFKIRNNRSTYVAIGDSMDSPPITRKVTIIEAENPTPALSACPCPCPKRLRTLCPGFFILSSLRSFFSLLFFGFGSGSCLRETAVVRTQR